jgi:hypothetical protein
MLPKEEFDAILANTERVSRIVMVLTVGLILLGFSWMAFGATYQLQDNSGNRVTLHDKDCHVPFLKGWKRADFRYEGKDLKACWIASRGMVFIVDDLGDLTPVPIQAFTKLQEG